MMAAAAGHLVAPGFEVTAPDVEMETSSNFGGHAEDIDIDLGGLSPRDQEGDYMLDDASSVGHGEAHPNDVDGHPDDIMTDDEDTTFVADHDQILDEEMAQSDLEEPAVAPEQDMSLQESVPVANGPQHDEFTTADVHVEEQSIQYDEYPDHFSHPTIQAPLETSANTEDIWAENTHGAGELHDRTGESKNFERHDSVGSHEDKPGPPAIGETAQSPQNHTAAPSEKNDTATVLERNSTADLAEKPLTVAASTPNDADEEQYQLDDEEVDASKHEHADVRQEDHFVKSSHAQQHPVVIVYQDSEMSLFPPNDEESSETYLLSDKTLLNDSFSNLLMACRSVLGDTLHHEEELEIGVQELGLFVSEDCNHASSTTLSEILDIYTQLHHADGKSVIEPLYLTLTTRTRFSTRLNALLQAAQEGKGISSLTYLQHDSDYSSELGVDDGNEAHLSYHESPTKASGLSEARAVSPPQGETNPDKESERPNSLETPPESALVDSNGGEELGVEKERAELPSPRHSEANEHLDHPNNVQATNNEPDEFDDNLDTDVDQPHSLQGESRAEVEGVTKDRHHERQSPHEDQQAIIDEDVHSIEQSVGRASGGEQVHEEVADATGESSAFENGEEGLGYTGTTNSSTIRGDTSPHPKDEPQGDFDFDIGAGQEAGDLQESGFFEQEWNDTDGHADNDAPREEWTDTFAEEQSERPDIQQSNHYEADQNEVSSSHVHSEMAKPIAHDGDDAAPAQSPDEDAKPQVEEDELDELDEEDDAFDRNKVIEEEKSNMQNDDDLHLDFDDLEDEHVTAVPSSQKAEDSTRYSPTPGKRARDVEFDEDQESDGASKRPRSR